MTTIRQLIQTSPAKANELLTRLFETPYTALKTRERLFEELKAELDLLAQLEEQHLFPVLRKHKETKSLVADALNDNKQIRKLVANLEQTPRESEEFAGKVAELRRVFQQSVRDEKKELLPAVLKALSDEEAQAIVENIEAGKADVEQAKRAEAEQRRAEAREERDQVEKVIAEEREQAKKAIAEQKEAADREQRAREVAQEAAQEVVRAGQAAIESASQVTRAAAQNSRQVATASLSTGSALWDTMFAMWGLPQGRSLAPARQAESHEQEEVIPLAEETLIVGKHTVENSRTTVRRFVVETPVQQEVSLYEERVVVERRKPVTDAATGETLTELTVEMVETSEVPVVGKRVAVREEVVVRRERTKRVETVRDTVRRDEIEIGRSDSNGRRSPKRAALASNRT
jgi:stress response protein YsnF